MILPHRGEIHSEFESVKKMCQPCDFASDTPMLTVPLRVQVTGPVVSSGVSLNPTTAPSSGWRSGGTDPSYGGTAAGQISEHSAVTL